MAKRSASGTPASASANVNRSTSASASNSATAPANRSVAAWAAAIFAGSGGAAVGAVVCLDRLFTITECNGRESRDFESAFSSVGGTSGLASSLGGNVCGGWATTLVAAPLAVVVLAAGAAVQLPDGPGTRAP